MERRQLGATGITVPTVGLGTYRVLSPAGDAQRAGCGAVIDCLLADSEGPALIDSSPMYGTAEETLASFIVPQGRRDKLVLANKIWSRSRALGEQQVERALGWFGYVDIYQVHNLLNFEDFLPYLARLKEEGRIGAVGASHYLPSVYPQLLELMRRRRLDVIQVPYHPLSRIVEGEVLPEAERLGVGVIVMTPFGSGQLVRRSPSAEELAPLAPFGVQTWAQAVLKWIVSDQRVHAVIPATRDPAHMRENLLAGAPPLFDSEARMYVRRLASKLESP